MGIVTGPYFGRFCDRVIVIISDKHCSKKISLGQNFGPCIREPKSKIAHEAELFNIILGYSAGMVFENFFGWQWAKPKISDGKEFTWMDEGAYGDLPTLSIWGETYCLRCCATPQTRERERVRERGIVKVLLLALESIHRPMSVGRVSMSVRPPDFPVRFPV